MSNSRRWARIFASICCSHSHEIPCMSAGGGVGLLCTNCWTERPHPLADLPVRYRRTQERRPELPTGIEREAMRRTQEDKAEAARMGVIL